MGHLGGLGDAYRIDAAWRTVQPPTQFGKQTKGWGEVEVSVAYEEPAGAQLENAGLYLDTDVRSLRLLGALFDECDASNTGVLDKAEFRRLYRKLKDLDAAGAAEREGDAAARAHAFHLAFRDAGDDPDEVTFDEVRDAARRAAAAMRPSKIEVVVHGGRNLARPPKEALREAGVEVGCSSFSWNACSKRRSTTNPFCTISLDGRRIATSPHRTHTDAPTWTYAADVSPTDAGDPHGEVASVELWHFRNVLSPTPLGRVDLDVLSEQLKANGPPGKAQTRRRWHRVMATDGFGSAPSPRG